MGKPVHDERAWVAYCRERMAREYRAEYGMFERSDYVVHIARVLGLDSSAVVSFITAPWQTSELIFSPVARQLGHLLRREVGYRG